VKIYFGLNFNHLDTI